MKFVFVILLFVSTAVTAQERMKEPEQVVAKPFQDLQAKLKGQHGDFDFVFRSQVIYPEDLLKAKVAADVAVYFTVTETGEVKNPEFKQEYPEGFKKEALRLLKFYQFEPFAMGDKKIASYSYVVFKFNPDTYKKFVKQRGYAVPKDFAKHDTSYVIYERADSSPEYYKGEEALGEFITSNLEYPDLAIRQNLQGTVILSFIVEPNGTVSNMVAEKEFNHLCTQEAFRIMRETKWKPGTKNGKLVRYRMKYPIVFNLNNVNKDNATSEQR